jgi:hypothetical protein
MVMPLEPGGGQFRQQLLLLGGVDQLLRREHDAEAAVPRHRRRQCPPLQGAAAQRFEPPLTVLALADMPQPNNRDDRGGQRRDQDRTTQRVELGAADVEGEPRGEQIEPG